MVRIESTVFKIDDNNDDDGDIHIDIRITLPEPGGPLGKPTYSHS
jgi:hypothetical protein